MREAWWLDSDDDFFAWSVVAVAYSWRWVYNRERVAAERMGLEQWADLGGEG